MGACRTPTASLRALQAERADRPRDPAAAARAAARIALAALPDVEREVLDAVRATGLPLVDPARCAALLPDGPRVDPLLRALLRRGLLSRRPGPGAGPWCAVPRAVAEVVPTEEPSTVPAALLAVPAPRPAGVDLPTTRHPTDLAALLQRLARHAADRTDPVAGIDALAPLATARTRRDDASAALDRAYAAALDLADRAGDPVLLGRAVHRLAAALAAEPGEAPDRAGLRNARTAFDLAIDLLTGRDDAAHAHALVDRAQLARRRDRAAEALADLHAAIALYRTLGRPVDVASAWQEVAAVERRAGHPCRAVAAHRSALAALVEAGDPTAAGWSRLAAGLVQVGELSEAPDLVAARRPDGPAARSVRELRELDPAAPDWALVAALTSGH
jgi:tetratricopeptide (TPR) repeat protein